ncbi:MAG: thiamine phosphate synthase [Thermodesulfovibrionales bacterium]|nr:thiamine phosphate synthase [Thermodesulfovibrionales bacterium]
MLPKLYLITDRKLFDDLKSFYDAIERALRGGIRLLQLREKDLSTKPLLNMAYELRALTGKYNAMFLINDRFDLALCVNADGVHLTQKSIPPFAIRQVVKKKLLIGVSTHSLMEAVRAQRDGADFLTLGPIYPTPSKLAYGEPLGLTPLKEITESISLPIFAIGGINHDNIKEVMATGAHGVAMIRGIFNQRDIEDSITKYLILLEERNNDKN